MSGLTTRGTIASTAGYCALESLRKHASAVMTARAYRALLSMMIKTTGQSVRLASFRGFPALKIRHAIAPAHVHRVRPWGKKIPSGKAITRTKHVGAHRESEICGNPRRCHVKNIRTQARMHDKPKGDTADRCQEKHINNVVINRPTDRTGISKHEHDGWHYNPDSLAIYDIKSPYLWESAS